jgi:putative hemolysin
MIYAATSARCRLRNHGGFLSSLIRDGVAGDVSTMPNDYRMLKTAGTIRIVPGRSAHRFAMEILQSDVAEYALVILDK